VSQSCTQCHGGSDGFRFYVQYGVGKTDVEPDNGLDCATCHDNVGKSDVEGEEWKRITVDSVKLPSGVEIDDDASTAEDRICGTCHQGRESGIDVDAAIAAGGSRGFINVHYKPAFATKLGGMSKIGAHYKTAGGQDKPYANAWTHTGPKTCVGCHSPKNTNHSFEVADNVDDDGELTCKLCHTTITDVREIRSTGTTNVPSRVGIDYDGDPATTTLHDEVLGLAKRVLIAMHAASPNGNKICRGESHPYFFVDTNGNAGADGKCEASESSRSNAYSFDLSNAVQQKLMRAAYNYQLAVEEPGIWAHNFDYIHQLLYDALVDLGVDVGALPKPKDR